VLKAHLLAVSLLLGAAFSLVVSSIQFRYLVVIDCKQMDNNCDSKDNQNRPIGCLSDTFVVYQVVVWNAVVGAELFEGGVELMDVVGKISPCINYVESQNDLSDCEYIQGLIVLLHLFRVDCNQNFVNDKGDSGDGHEDRVDENIALNLFKSIV
jgi:hypothetical protein